MVSEFSCWCAPVYLLRLRGKFYISPFILSLPLFPIGYLLAHRNWFILYFLFYPHPSLLLQKKLFYLSATTCSDLPLSYLHKSLNLISAFPIISLSLFLFLFLSLSISFSPSLLLTNFPFYSLFWIFWINSPFSIMPGWWAWSTL